MQTCLRRCRADPAVAGPRRAVSGVRRVASGVPRLVSGVPPTASIAIRGADPRPLARNL